MTAIKTLLLASTISIVALGNLVPAWATVETIPLAKLTSLQKSHQSTLITLPTVRSQQVLTFTKPKTWTLGAQTTVKLSFQHSKELLPKSWLQVLVNDQVIKHIALTKDNAEGSTLSVPIPVAKLKDFNTLTFRVEQHYTDKCEDPLDPSLWTQVLPSTQLLIDYTPSLPKLDLAAYPYPIIDTLQYATAPITAYTGKSSEAINALALVQAHFGQHSPNNAVTMTLGSGNTLPGKGHAVLIGTPQTLPTGGGFSAKIAQALNGAGPNTGVLALFPSPTAKGETVLVVSGNSDQGVLNAATALTSTPKPTVLLGTIAVLPGSWTPGGLTSTKTPRFIEFDSKTLAQLGYVTEAVEKINAPPISYSIPVVTDFKKSGAKLFWDVVYSYGPGINPEFSSLELRVNNRSIGNIPLTNTMGEDMAHASIPVSAELLQPNNTVVAQFHLMPDKAGYCIDNYVDKAWGKLHDDSTFRVEGKPASRLPDVGLLNPTAYPYSLKDNLEDTVLVLPSNADANTLTTALAVAGRLGRVTNADTDLRLHVQWASAGLPKDKHVILLGNAADYPELKSALNLLQDGNTKTIKQANNTTLTVQDLGQGATLQQAEIPASGGHVLTLLSSKTASGWALLQQLFNTDKAFETLTLGQVKALNTPLAGDATGPAINTGLAQAPSVGVAEATTGNSNDYGSDPWYQRWFGGWGLWTWLAFGAGVLLVLSLIGRLLGGEQPKPPQGKTPKDPFSL
jgi:cellulose synthase operon protein B